MRRAQILAAGFALAFAARVPALAAPPSRGASITLIDQNARPFTIAALRGRPVLLTFVATRCTDTCPIANAAFLALARELVRRRVDATLLTVTLDPRHDTPFVMARFAHQLGAVAPRWRFASGDAGSVQRLLGAFGVVVQPDADGIPDVHSTAVFVLDRDGRLRRTMLLSTDFVQQALSALAVVA
jgi:protein SCO1/2